MRMATLVAAAHAAAILLAAQQQQLPVVQVDFQIVDTRFVNELGAGRAMAEKAFRPIVVKALEERIGFVKFATTTTPPGDRGYRLAISLGDAASAIGEVRFNLRLWAPTGGLAGQVSWLFRVSRKVPSPSAGCLPSTGRSTIRTWWAAAASRASWRAASAAATSRGSSATF